MFPRLAILILVSVTLVPAAGPAVSASSGESSAAAAAHVLNRLAYGPRPGDIERVQRMGVQAWIDRQLQPARVDDSALEARLATFETLTLDAETIFKRYHEPAILARRAAQRQAANSQDSASEVTGPKPQAPSPRPQAPGPRPQDVGDRLVLAELSEARLLRAVYSERQLEEVLVDFWFNHFNVFAGKGPIRAYVTSFERDAIRPYVLGDFRRMLEAVAQSPAMLFYLDNWQNVSPSAQATRLMHRGINENYARELLELHTLGVDGGYTQEDIVNVARAFTGWTMRPRQSAAFQFVPALHDRDEKRVLGHTIKGGGGIEDGQQVLDILVAHPSTARFIATKLAQRFIGDAPPSALVERAARRFQETRGNLREVTRVIVTAPEFLAPAAYRTKVKTPLEFVASALRATGAEVRTALPLVRTLRDLGMPLYFCQPPTGYDETGDTWVSSGALVARMNFALELGRQQLRGIRVPDAASPDTLRDALTATALGGDLSEGTRATVAKATTSDQVLALLIGSPEFQRQ